MADNVTLPAAGAQIATEDVAGVQYQIIKIAIGGDGVATLVDANNPLPAGGIRRDADTAFGANLTPHPFLFNDAGRLKVSATPADQAVTTGSITASTQTVFVNVRRMSNLSISMATTALAGHNITFEASNNSTNGVDGNWYIVQVVRSNANTVESASGVLAATPAYMWQVNVSDYQWFRVRATAHTSGTANYTISPSSYASEPIPATQVSGTQPVSGSVSVSGTSTITPTNPTSLAINSAATTNAGIVKGSAGNLYAIGASNTGAAAAYLKLYNKATSPTVGTDVPVLVLPLQPNSVLEFDMGVLGYRFSTGISVAITNLAPDTDTTAIAAAQVKALVSYI